MDMAEACIVSEHFDIDSADQKLLHLLFWEVTLEELKLEALSLQSDDLVFLLLRSRLTN